MQKGISTGYASTNISHIEHVQIQLTNPRARSARSSARLSSPVIVMARSGFSVQTSRSSVTWVAVTVRTSMVGAGAFKTMVTINGKTVPAIIDTGATFVTMSAKTAGELGLGYEGGKQMKMNTANGTTTNNAIMLDRVTVGGITLSRVEGAVGQTDMPVLIGMSFLRRVNMTTNGNVMTLVRP